MFYCHADDEISHKSLRAVNTLFSHKEKFGTVKDEGSSPGLGSSTEWLPLPDWVP